MLLFHYAITFLHSEEKWSILEAGPIPVRKGSSAHLRGRPSQAGIQPLQEETMFELHQLEQFLAVVEQGTVSKAAEKLNITQPALSRSLQNLEYQLQVPLFIRSKNKVTLTPTGLYTADLARSLLARAAQLEESVREYHRTHSKLIIASCAPCELLFQVQELARSHFAGIECETVVDTEEKILAALLEGSCSMALFSREIHQSDLIQRPLKSEQLFAMIPADHPLSKNKSLSFRQINGESVIPFPLKGHWNSLLEEKLPDSTLLYQNSIQIFDKVVHASNLISFESNLLEIPLKNHIKIPIQDPEAEITYHLALLKTKEKEFRSFLPLLKNL